MGRCAECGQDDYQTLRAFKEVLEEEWRTMQETDIASGILRAIRRLEVYMEKFKTLGE